MSLSLKEELLKLSSTAPKLRDPDDVYSDDETRAKVDSVSNEYQDELEFKQGSSLNRIRPAIGDLSEYGKRYKGKSVSRRDVENEFDSASEQLDEDDDEEDEGEDEEDEEDEGEDEVDEEDEDDDEDGDENDDEQEPKPKPQKQKSSEDKISILNSNHDEEIAKGKAVKNQLNFWDILLDTRIKLQNLLNTANQYPQFDYYEEIFKKLGETFKRDQQTVEDENQSYLIKAINQLIELQQRLVLIDPETNYMLKELNLTADVQNSTSESAKKKRKRSSDDEEDDEEAGDEDDEDDDDDDEEIYSDTDEELRANELKKAKKLKNQHKKMSNFTFTPIEPAQLENYLSKFNQEFQKYRNATIQKWYDKTRLTSGKSFAALERPIMQQIEQILMDKDRIIKRTQLKRTAYNVCAKREDKVDANKITLHEAEGSLRDRHLKDYDEEIFDDQDFYNQLLRELIDRRTNNIADPIELARKSIELQKLRSKNKKKVDTKASKGRKLRFNVHKPMVNFMAPMNRSSMSDEAKNELFQSLFGNHVTMSTSKNGNDDVDFSAIFKGFN